MIRAISIHNLRGIRDGKLEGLTNLVILVGPNSSGKSTVLDALLIGASAPPPHEVFNQIVPRRKIENAQQWILFRERGVPAPEAAITLWTEQGPARRTTIVRQSPSNSLQFSTNYVNGQEQEDPAQRVRGRANVAVPTPPDVPEIRLVDPDDSRRPLADLYTEVARRGLVRQAKSIVTELMPELQDVEILTEQGKPVIYLDYQEGALPLALAGDGVRLLLQQSLELAARPGGAILLEEPEVRLHPGAIRQSAKAMLVAVSRGVQVILSTHSLELIDAILSETKTEDLDKISIYRLQLKDGQLKSVRMSGAEAAVARTQIEEDLR